MAKNSNPEKHENENENKSNLVGYVRRSNAGGAIKVSINSDAFADCDTYVTSDGQEYVPLVISLNALNKVLSGERVVTTISQIMD
ncbi:MAG TPA: hypothetical protein HA327_02305 [Candidatus Poseidoniaceae archaeon]|nr:MAG TPA: hypothetical protein D7H81_02290 [Candidatus Poseidoniales archaeon]HII44849.1 hypothetical protein [Candidatus Poseidoniaceae archaeon]|tara:strand:+ start:674 stop:928 length:255 start_codon:yes stop_codon:yes gene_type:complete